jgi:hypothetical protein
MSERVVVNITFPVDEHGMVGRQCPSCGQYFKIKPGTGLRGITTTACPYCEHRAENSDFTTDAQIEYAKSIAVNRVLGPKLRKFQRTLKSIERKSRGSLIQFKVTGTNIRFPIKYYSEKELETIVECDSCGLLFSIYGVIASCPDCLRLSPMSMFKKSLEAVGKRFDVLKKIPETETELRQGLIADSLSAGVAAFDGLGKKLKKLFPSTLPERPRNLFQNLSILGKILHDRLGFNIVENIGEADYLRLNYMFQVRHIWIHNFGEADSDFVKNTNSDKSIIGVKIEPSGQEVKEFLDIIEKLGFAIRTALEKSV